METARLYGYLSVFLFLLVLLFLGRKEPVRKGEVSSFLVPFRKSAAFLYRKRSGRKRAADLLRRTERVQRDLSLLDPSAGIREAQQYCITSLQNLLVLIFLADVMALLVYASTAGSGYLHDGSIERDTYQGSDRNVTLSVEGGEDFDLTVESRRYTTKQADEMEQELAGKLPSLILGENGDLMHVRSDLNLVHRVKGYPFRISWSASDYTWLDTDGTVHSEDIPENESAPVVLTAVLSLYGNKWEEKFPAVLLPPLLTDEEKFQKDVQEAVLEREEQTRTSEAMELPDTVDGTAVVFGEVLEDPSLSVFLLLGIAAVCVYFSGQRDLSKKVKKRSSALESEYPGLVSRLELFLGTGMSVRNVFFRIAKDYGKRREAGEPKKYVCEEILLLCRELESGVPERTACTDFGKRCGLRSYTRLCSLLVQNGRKGNAALLSCLQQEAQAALSERRDRAVRLGEEAGTKLLIPMMMLLIVVMLMVAVPAYLGFSF